MAHKGVWTPGTMTMASDVAKGEFVVFHTTAGQLTKQTTAAAQPYGVAVRDLKSGELFDGHHALPPSEVIECKTDEALDAQDEVLVTAAGQIRALVAASDTDVFVVGRVIAAAADGDITEVYVAPRFISS